MTLDDVAAAMRARFTESRGAPVQITAEEWDTMAVGVYLRDALEDALTGSVTLERVAKILDRAGRRR